MTTIPGAYGKVHYLKQKRHGRQLKVGKFIDKNKVVKWYPPGRQDAMPLGESPLFMLS